MKQERTIEQIKEQLRASKPDADNGWLETEARKLFEHPGKHVMRSDRNAIPGCTCYGCTFVRKPVKDTK